MKNKKKIGCRLIAFITSLAIAYIFSSFLCPVETSPAQSTVLSENTETAENKVAVPIIMYHALTNIPKYQNKYFIDPSLFESDLNYLVQNGYTAVHISDLTAFVEKGTPLPEKPIILTFDDGYYNNYLYAYPLLKKYNMKAVISPVGKLVDEFSMLDDTNEYYAYLTWEHIREMQLSGVIEIQNHTYDMHIIDKNRKGAMQASDESPEAYVVALTKDLLEFQNKAYSILGTKPTALVYPYGAYNKISEAIAKDLGFKATITCTEGMNYISNTSDSLYSLKRFLRDEKASVDKILADYR